MLSALSSWLTTISLIFGGCCSNAITLEQITLEHPNAGSVLTLFQFLVISLHGLPKFVVWTRFGPRLRPRRVPITAYLLQVILFYLISLLNNAAFAYRIPMAVHIIFRSGGLMISLLLGWLISKKQYTLTQVLSVILVTLGVIVTTLSAQSSSSKSSTPLDPYTYATGISILTLALVLSGFLGLLQDWSYAKYGRPSLGAKSTSTNHPSSEGPAPWQESMFYLHILALPMFLPLLPDLAEQMHQISTTGPRSDFNVHIPIPTTANLTAAYTLNIIPPYWLPSLPIQFFRVSQNISLLSIAQVPLAENATRSSIVFALSIPQIYLPLILNTVTQLLCVAGVHRLTTRVSALTVTLVLVVRKAVSLIISVIGVNKVGLAARQVVVDIIARLASLLGLSLEGGIWFSSLFGVDVDGILRTVGSSFVGAGTTKRSQQVDDRMMWTGAIMVLLGTVGYTIGSRPREVKKVETKGKGKTE